MYDGGRFFVAGLTPTGYLHPHTMPIKRSADWGCGQFPLRFGFLYVARMRRRADQHRCGTLSSPPTLTGQFPGSTVTFPATSSR